MLSKMNQTQSQSQKLALSPQVKLYLKVLQMSLQELKNNLEEEMNQNPLLEEDPTASELPESEEEAANPGGIDNWESTEESSAISNPFDENLADTKELTRKKNYQDSIITQEITLIEHVQSQIHLLDLTGDEKSWTEEFIGNLDENGFLKIGLSELANQLKVLEQDLEVLLQKLQTLDPPGIFARSLEECLLIQLGQSHDKEASLAQKIIRDHFKLLQKNSFPQLARILKVSPESIKAACGLIHELDPKPGKSFIPSRSFQMVPDAVITTEGDDSKKYQVEIRETGLPHLRLNSEYRKMLKNKELEPKTKQFIKEKATQALWLLEAVENRKATLGSILKEILDRQPEFVEKGFSTLKPLRMKEIAEKLGIHESTVSRAVSGKFIQTPLGSFPLRDFFSGKIESGEESEESQKSVLGRIKRLIDEEDSKKPLSDQKIVELLSKDGIVIARRTVAKYREILRILPTSLRRKR